MDFEKALESIKTIKLTGGIFGKTSLLLMVLCICVSAVAIKLGSIWFSFIFMGALIGIVFYALKRCLDFAENNPQAAIMDGAELLVHERLVHGTKSAGPHEPRNPTIEHEAPRLPPEEVFAEDIPPEDDGQQNSGGTQ